jgi:hypothetical protein
MSNMDLMDRLLATLRMRLPGVTQQALSLELFNCIDEFFRQSSAWRWETSVPLIEGTTQYPIFPPAGTDMVQVMGAEHRGFAVRPISDTGDGSVVRQRGRIIGFPVEPDFDTTFEPDVTSTTSGGVFAYSIYFPSYVNIDIAPSSDATQYPFHMLLALSLNYQCLEDEPNEWPLEEWMFATFNEAWLDGTQGRLMSQINKPYSNPAVAQYHMKRFRKFCARAKQTAARGYIYNKPNWQFPRFA